MSLECGWINEVVVCELISTECLQTFAKCACEHRVLLEQVPFSGG